VFLVVDILTWLAEWNTVDFMSAESSLNLKGEIHVVTRRCMCSSRLPPPRLSRVAAVALVGLLIVASGSLTGMGATSSGNAGAADQPIVGLWQVVDAVVETADFDPEGTPDPDRHLCLVGLGVSENGTVTQYTSDGLAYPCWYTWSENWLCVNGCRTKAHYEIRTIDEEEYLFMPWLSGDVTIRGLDPVFYVLSRLDSSDPVAVEWSSRRFGHACIRLGETNIENGLYLNAGGDCDTEVVAVGEPSTEARQTGDGRMLAAADGNDTPDHYMQFDLEDALLFEGAPTSRIRIEVDYFDQGSDGFQLQYDASGTAGPFGNGMFTNTDTIWKTDTGAFKTAALEIENAYFGNRDLGADFRIDDRGDGVESIRSVTVTLLPAEEIEPPGPQRSEISILLGETNAEDGLYLDSGFDYDTEGVLVGEPAVAARRTGNGQPLTSRDGNAGSDSYMQFDVDDAVLYQGSPTGSVRIEIEYLDQGTDRFSVDYDAAGDVGPYGTGVFTSSDHVYKTDTGTFKTAVFELDNVYFGNRDNGADFRIADYADGPEVIRSVTVTLLFPDDTPAAPAADAPMEEAVTADTEIIGTWYTVDYVDHIEEFDPAVPQVTEAVIQSGFPQFDFLPDGQIAAHAGTGETITSFLSWNEEMVRRVDGRAEAQYEIREIENETYLFLPWLSGDVTDRGMEPFFYVLSLTDPERTAAEPIVGSWISVDYLRAGVAFNANMRTWKSELFLVAAEFSPTGSIQMTTEEAGTRPAFFAWADGHIERTDGLARAPYEIREIDGVEYLFLPWLVDSVLTGEREPGHYILVRPGADVPALRDQDGDGVPDNQDLCPDWPGDPAMDGC
jgi:hypothetical protein